MSRAPHAVIAVVLVIAIAATLGWQYRQQLECPVDDTALLLRSSVAGGIRPRWTGCFDRPLKSLGAPSLLTPIQVSGAVASFELMAERRTRGMAALGIARALSGDTDRAVAILGAEADEQNPDALTNLAAAHLTAALRTERPSDVARALDYASHAVAISPRHRPALFNQALALTLFGLDEDAERAWRHYLTLEGEAEWRDHARGAIAALRQEGRPAAEFDEAFGRADWDGGTVAVACQAAPQTCRERVEETLLPNWARVHARGDTAAAERLLARAEVLARALATRGDVLDVQTVDDLRAALRRRDARLADIAAGLIAYGDARAAFEDDHESIPLFLEAERRLGAAMSPMRDWARANRVYAEFNRYTGPQLETVGRLLQEWGADASSRGYHALAGRLFYLQSLTFANRANYAGAEPLFRDSIAELQRTREAGHLAASLVIVADTRMRLGDTEAAWQALHDAVGVIPEIASARRRYAILLNVASWMRETSLPYGAILLLTSARDTALKSNQLLRVAESSLNRAKAYAAIGDLAAARADLEIARPDPAKNGRWGTGERARHEYLAGVAEVERDVRPRLAIDAASQAMTFFEGRQYAERVAPLHLVRGRAYAAANEPELAEKDFADGIATYVQYRRTIPTAQQRLLSQDVVWELYEERLRLAALRSPDEAFAVAEEGRGRTLLESLGDSGGRAISVVDLQRALSPEVRVLYYALLPRELLIWAISHSDITFRRVAVDRVELERRIVALYEALQRGASTSEWHRLAEALFALTIRPVETALPVDATVIVLADGALHRLPFAVLRDGRSGRYLIETRAVATEPSAALLALHARQPREARRPKRLLAITDPAADSLDALPGAAREGQSIARLYPHAEIVSRASATKVAFMLAAPEADVVHFAGHAVASPEYPLLAHLEFAGEAAVGGSTELEAAEIAGMRLHRTHLIVLAACTTAGGQVRRGEGVLSLARPFLIAGAPTVVATLWDIDDAASALFLDQFHRRYVSGGDAARALRESQTWALHVMEPSTWAAFVSIGVPGLSGSQGDDAR